MTEARKNGDIIIFTRDLHYEEDYFCSVESAFVPPHCMADGNGHWIIKELQPYIPVDYIANKSTYGYLFWGDCYIATKSTYGYLFWGDWHNMLDDADVIELCGVCTDICVISNALILRSTYPTVSISVDASCCAGLTSEKHRAALEVMKSCNIEVINE